MRLAQKSRLIGASGVYFQTSDERMGRERRSMRVAARSAQPTSSAREDKGYSTPRISSKISNQRIQEVSAIFTGMVDFSDAEISENSEEMMNEEFSRSRRIPQLETIKKQLSFGERSRDEPKLKCITASFRARKVRVNGASLSQKATDKGKPVFDVGFVKPEVVDGGVMLRSKGSPSHPEVPNVGPGGANDQWGEASLGVRPAEKLLETNVKIEPTGCTPNQKLQAEDVPRRMEVEGRRITRSWKLEAEKSADIVKQEPNPDTKKIETNIRRRKEKITTSPDLVKSEADELADIVKQEPINPKVRTAQASLRRRKEEGKILTRDEAKVSEDVKQETKSDARLSRRKYSDAMSAESPAGNNRKKVRMAEDSSHAVPAESSLPLALLDSTRMTVCARGAELACETSSVALGLSVPYRGPYPSHARPYPEECEAVRDLLSNLHGHLPEYERHKKSCPSIEPPPIVQDQGSYESGDSVAVGETDKPTFKVSVVSTVQGLDHIAVPTGHPSERRTVLDSLVGTVLSQNTTDNNSRKAFANLKKVLPTWELVHKAEPKDVEEAIRCGGLAVTKAGRILDILNTLVEERGEICMEYLRNMSNEEIKKELSRFKGVGPKTVACLLMFHLQRNEFPVDTHVFRISKALGWVPEAANRETAYLHLNQRIPDHLKFDIHCLFVTHGKRCPKCAKRHTQQPKDGECPLVNWKSRALQGLPRPPVLLLDSSQPR